jgi:trk/ktr system potassium uptake protein
MVEYAVIGMGRFGRATARSLAGRGESVLAIDRDPQRLDQVVSEVASISVADTTEPGQVEALALDRMACAVVAIGGRATEASLLTTALLRQAGVPRVVARSFDDRHARLLLSIGAHEVINPEDAMGRDVAARLALPSVRGQTALGDQSLAVIESPEAFAGRSLADLDLAESFQVTLLAVRRAGRNRLLGTADVVLESGDLLVVVGGDDAVARIAGLI